MTRARSLPEAARACAEILLMVAAATGLGLILAPRWGDGAVDLLYLLPVLAAASVHGLAPALLAAFVSTLAFNFFFTEPVHSFRVDSPADIVILVMLFVVALVVSQLASAMRAQARIAAANAARNAAIAGFAGRLLSAPDAGDIGRVACGELAALFDCNAALLVPSGEAETETLASAPSDAMLTPGDRAAASWVIANGEQAGRGSPRLNPAEWLFFPVRSGSATRAAMGLARDDGRPPVEEEKRLLLESLLDQAALALDRAAYAQDAQGVAQLRDRDRLRGALLSSVGHDLRTPLTAIAAAGAELRRQAPRADLGLVATLEAETAKLDRYVANLLDMARIEAGAIRLREEPVDLVDAVSAAQRDLQRALAGHAIGIDLPAYLPLVRADPHLLHHMLINLLDNAARHGAADGAILLSAASGEDGVTLAVEDEGPGLPQGDAFGTFSRIAGSDRTGGAGLGLAIVRGFGEAMGVILSAGNRAGGAGARFSLRFPPELVLGETAMP
jgi:two-component system, OmpR family, sensor histidine kinase KdpD